MLEELRAGSNRVKKLFLTLCIASLSGRCYGFTTRGVTIRAQCSDQPLCIELFVKDHRNNQLGFDNKTGKEIEAMDGGAYYEESVPSLDEPGGPPFKAINISEPLPGLYTANVIGIRRGVYVVEALVTAYGDYDITQVKSFAGILDKNDIHTLVLTVPIDNTNDHLIKKIIDLPILEKEIRVAKKAKFFPEKDLANILLKQVRLAKDSYKKGMASDTKKHLENMILELEEAQKRKESLLPKDHPMTAIAAILSEVKLLLEALQ